MLVKILILVGGVLVLFLGYIAMQPKQYKIQSEILINASPEVIFPEINNSEKSFVWMPWKEVDPQMKISFSGPSDGVGSVAIWESPGEMGTGTATISESIPNQIVKTQLYYKTPMEMKQLAEISLTPTEGGTKVVWSTTGENNFIGRVFYTVLRIEKTVGKNFLDGLTNLKNKVQAQSPGN